MNLRKITWSQISTALLFLFVVALLYSPRLKSWVIMGLMTIGFFKPDIPQPKPGDKREPVPAMLVHNTDGKRVDLQQQKGKVVFINFWATWCPPCLAELPSVNALYQKVKTDTNVVFITVDVDNDLIKSTQFIHNKGYTFPVYGGSPADVPDKFYSNGIPTTLVVDKKGNIVFSHFNRANYDDQAFTEFISELAKQ